MTIKPEHVEQAEKYDPLTPVYFASRDIIDEYMKTLNEESIDKLARAYSDKIYTSVSASFEAFLLSDASLNIQQHFYRMVDECVGALISGEPWVFKKYVLGKYNCEDLRIAVAKHIPQEIMDQRLLDLTKENEQLKESLKMEREIGRRY